MPSKAARIETDQVKPISLQLELEGFSPSAADSEGITLLLKHVFDDKAVSAADLAAYIVKHNKWGTVVKPVTDDDDDSESEEEEQIVLALTTAIDLSESAASEFPVIGRLRTFIQQTISASKSISARDTMLSYFDSSSDSRLYLLLNERFDNLPLSVCANSVSVLPAEFSDASISPTHLLLLSRAKKGQNGLMEYTYPEVEQLLPFASATLEAPSEPCSTDTVCDFNSYIVLLFNMDRFSDILDALRNHV